MKTFISLLLVAGAVAISGFSYRSCDFTGSWDTNWGTLEIKSTGTSYTGSYFHNGVQAGTIKGTMSSPGWTGGVVYLKGTWQQGKANGKFELKRECIKRNLRARGPTTR